MFQVNMRVNVNLSLLRSSYDFVSRSTLTKTLTDLQKCESFQVRKFLQGLVSSYYRSTLTDSYLFSNSHYSESALLVGNNWLPQEVFPLDTVELHFTDQETLPSFPDLPHKFGREYTEFAVKLRKLGRRVDNNFVYRLVSIDHPQGTLALHFEKDHY